MPICTQNLLANAGRLTGLSHFGKCLSNSYVATKLTKQRLVVTHHKEYGLWWIRAGKLVNKQRDITTKIPEKGKNLICLITTLCYFKYPVFKNKDDIFKETEKEDSWRWAETVTNTAPEPAQMVDLLCKIFNKLSCMQRTRGSGT